MVIQNYTAILLEGPYDGYTEDTEPTEVMKGIWSAPYLMHMKSKPVDGKIEREYDPKTNGSVVYEKFGAPDIKDGKRIFRFKYSHRVVVK